MRRAADPRCPNGRSRPTAAGSQVADQLTGIRQAHRARPLGETTEAARIQAVVNSCLGHMVGYEAGAGGRLFQDMAPSPAMART
ncbi:hypothetical protein [Geodermatophilus nigrescens]